MTWQIPWVIAGVDEVPLSTARTMAYVTTLGREGVVASTHLTVSANTTPNGAVNVSTGVFVAVNKFMNASFESYVGRNESNSVSVSVPSTGGTSRTDLVYAHITDPGQSGHYPTEPTVAAPVETRVITNVSPTITRVQEHPGYENQSGLALARITRPANTTTVQNAHITDLRVLLDASLSPIGQMTQYAGSTQPYGWLFCQGQAVPRTTYAALFNAIGTTYGAGDSINTFNLPDMRGRTPIGAGTGDAPYATAHTLGQKKGAEKHLLDTTEMPSHTHIQNSHNHTQDSHSHTIYNSNGGGSAIVGGDALTLAEGGYAYAATQPNGSAINTSTTATNQPATATNQSTGGGAAHNNMQPASVVNFIIKAY